MKMLLTFDALEGSPFNSEGTQPRNESVVTRFSLTNIAKLDDSSDPLLGGNTRADNIKNPSSLPIETTEELHLHYRSNS